MCFLGNYFIPPSLPNTIPSDKPIPTSDHDFSESKYQTLSLTLFFLFFFLLAYALLVTTLAFHCPRPLFGFFHSISFIPYLLFHISYSISPARWWSPRNPIPGFVVTVTFRSWLLQWPKHFSGPLDGEWRSVTLGSGIWCIIIIFFWRHFLIWGCDSQKGGLD